MAVHYEIRSTPFIISIMSFPCRLASLMTETLVVLPKPTKRLSSVSGGSFKLTEIAKRVGVVGQHLLLVTQIRLPDVV